MNILLKYDYVSSQFEQLSTVTVVKVFFHQIDIG